MHNFRNLVIWQKARILVKASYKLSKKLPKEETWGLMSQIQRASVSIPSNIAEGSGKSSNKDFTRFLEMSISSGFELESHFILSFDLEYITEEELNQISCQIQELQKMIYSFMQTLK